MSVSQLAIVTLLVIVAVGQQGESAATPKRYVWSTLSVALQPKTSQVNRQQYFAAYRQPAQVYAAQSSNNAAAASLASSTESSSSTSSPDRYVSGTNTDETAGVKFLRAHDRQASIECRKAVVSEWNYAANITEENKQALLSQALEYAEFQKVAWRNATSFAWKNFSDPLVRRWFKILSVLGKAALPADKLREFNEIQADMENNYSTAKICPQATPDSTPDPSECTLELEPDLTRILSQSRDWNQLAHVWTEWRNAAGKPVRNKFLRYVQLSNDVARLNGFNNMGEMWRERFESDTFEQDLENLWEQIMPLYQHLHAYVRKRLRQLYGSDKISSHGPIPAHLLGNMWAQSWRSLADILLPYPDRPSVDVTETMQAKNMTALQMFKVAEEFFTSLGLKPMTREFWERSIIEKPADREIVCHASAWDFCDGRDFRIKQCTDINMRDLITTHHEMGHIQYFMQYALQPYVFREGANPGFHEAIGDTIALSAATPSHLHKIQLLPNISADPQGELNYLMSLALDKITFLPSGYLMDLWRWKVFSGQIKSSRLNTEWWELRNKIQGVCPPVRRTEADFDPAAKYHISANVPYIRYFVSYVIQFQFHKALCEAAGHNGSLHTCDVYQSREAGQLLSEVLQMGSSEPWMEAMKIMTGGQTDKMDAKPLLDFFAPLLNWLKEQNRGEQIGWDYQDPNLCPGL